VLTEGADVGGGAGWGDDLQTRNDQITLCGRKILLVEEMGGNSKHHNIKFRPTIKSNYMLF
jgi:hypothetical protein